MIIKNIKPEDLTLSLSIVAVSGISGCSPIYSVCMILSTPALTMGNCVVEASQSVFGSIKLWNNDQQLEKLGVSEGDISKHNKAVLDGCFDEQSPFFCFSRGTLDNFQAALPCTFLIKKISGKGFDPVSGDFLTSLSEIFKQKISAIGHEFSNGTLKEFQAVTEKLRGLA